MKFSIFSFLFILPFLLNAQHHIDTNVVVKSYMPIKLYKENYTRNLTKNDTLNFRIKDNDTLVLITDDIKSKGRVVPYEPKDSTFLYYYKKVAFNHKDNDFSKNTSMKYWKSDIKIYFSPSVTNKTKNNLMSFAKEISKNIDSLNIYQVKHIEESNYIIYYFGDYEYEPKMVNYKSSDYYIYWNKNRINRGSIKLDTKKFFNEKLIQHKLREFFIQSIGHFKLIDDFDCESYFSDCYAPDKKLTALDLEILSYHYSYGICKGTSLEIFEEQHKNAQEIYEKTGHLIRFIHPDID